MNRRQRPKTRKSTHWFWLTLALAATAGVTLSLWILSRRPAPDSASAPLSSADGSAPLPAMPPPARRDKSDPLIILTRNFPGG